MREFFYIKKGVVICFFCLVNLGYVFSQDPDSYSESIEIGPGAMPSMAIAQDSSLHLTYVSGDYLIYSIGDLSGNFNTIDTVIENCCFHDPRIFLDQNDDPHIVVSDGNIRNRYTWYTNRIGGYWRNKFTVWDSELDNSNRCTSPSIWVDSLMRAYIGVFTVGINGADNDRWGGLVRVDSLAAEVPVITKKQVIDVWNPTVLMVNGELWIGGRNKEKGDRNYTLQQHDTLNLNEKGPFYNLSHGVHGEQGRCSVDKFRDIHCAGTLNKENYYTTGWYNTLSRAKKTLRPHRYFTTNKNATGAGLPMMENHDSSNVYLLYWSGGLDRDHNEPKGCVVNNQVTFTRFKGDVQESVHMAVDDKDNIHGDSYRATPCMVPHPEKGMMLVFTACKASGEKNLRFTTIGRGGKVRESLPDDTVTKIRITSRKDSVVTLGRVWRLSYDVSPFFTNKKIASATSSNEDVIVANNTVLEAVGIGTSVITVTPQQGMGSDQITIRVKERVVAGLDKNEAGESFVLMPNPNSGKVKFQTKLDVRAIDIFSLEGKKLITITELKNSVIHFKKYGLDNGTYVLKAYSKQKTIVQKFILE